MPRVEVLLSLSVVRAFFARRRSVRDDWVAWLPPDKLALFKSVATRWERNSTMSGIALHDALELRDQDRFEPARLHVEMATELVTRNAIELSRAVNVLHNEARHVAELPAVEPLDPSNFCTTAARRVAHWNTMFHWILFDARSQFFQKLRVLGLVIDDASSSFAASAEELLDSELTDREAPWSVLADLECDLNTSARELEVILKTLLRNLPPALTEAIRDGLEAAPASTPRRSRARRSRIST
jgi:hypothetical protein